MKISSVRLALMAFLLVLLPWTSALAQVRVVQTNSRDGSIHIIDAENGEVVAKVETARIAVGDSPKRNAVIMLSDE